MISEVLIGTLGNVPRSRLLHERSRKAVSSHYMVYTYRCVCVCMCVCLSLSLPPHISQHIHQYV